MRESEGDLCLYDAECFLSGCWGRNSGWFVIFCGDPVVGAVCGQYESTAQGRGGSAQVKEKFGNICISFNLPLGLRWCGMRIFPQVLDTARREVLDAVEGLEIN